MKFSPLFLHICLVIGFLNLGLSQEVILDSNRKVTEKLNSALDSCDPCHYTAQMRFKEGASDSFDQRNFEVSFASDSSNLIYGYNWKIAETLDSGHVYTLIASPENLFSIYSGNRKIGKFDLPETIDLGSLQEYLRRTFILREVCIPFVNSPAEGLVVKDTSGYYYLTLSIDEISTHELVLNKDTYLAVRSVVRIKDSTFDFEQITEIIFDYDDQVRPLSGYPFSIDQYISQGYSITEVKNSDPSETTLRKPLSPEGKALLLDYQFVSEANDTTVLRELNADYILLDFWFSSCLPCLRALPRINQLALEYSQENLVVVGINCFDKLNKVNVASKLRNKDVSFPLLFGERDLLQAIGMNSFPSYLLITPDRKIQIVDGYTKGVEELLKVIFQ